MESKISTSEIIENKPAEEATSLEHRNTFILSLINKLGNYFDKKFKKYNNYFSDDEIDKLKCLFDYFSACCEKKNKIVKKLAINLIFSILVKINAIEKHYENFINVLVEAIISASSFKNEDKFLNKVINSDLKLCINQEQYDFIIKYIKIHILNINLLLNLLIHFFKENSEKDIIRLICHDLKAKYPKLIISDSNIDSIDMKKEDYFICLSKLINLDYKSMVDVEILEFEDCEFKLRMPSNDELDSYIREEPQTKKKRKSKRLSHETNSEKISPYSSNEKDSNYETNYSDTSNETSNYAFDVNNLNPFEKFIFNEMKKSIQASNEAKEDLADTKIRLKKVENDLQLEKNRSDRLENESINTKYKLEKAEHYNEELEVKIQGLEMDMKIIKIRAIYKGIIDIFAKVFKINLWDSYYVKNEKIFKSLSSFPKSEKVSELKNFLSNILSYIYEGNDLAHWIDGNILPLDWAFSVLEEDGNLHFKYLKNILIDLSLNSTLKYAYKYYINQDDDEKF